MEFSATDRIVMDGIRRAGGLDSDEAAIRVALWRLAEHLGVDARGAFDLPYRASMRALLDAERRRA